MPPVCAAGALHSIYGTNAFEPQTIALDARETIRALFGERAERLAFLFHRCRRPGDIISGNLVDRFSGEPLEVSGADIADLRLIEAANLLEQGAPVPEPLFVRYREDFLAHHRL